MLPACPPASGTVEEMTARVRQYETALVLMIEHMPKDYTDRQEQKAAKRHQNELTEQLIGRMRENGTTDTLMMGAGPWKTASCMSAYCVNAQKMADFVGMKCWDNDGKIRYFCSERLICRPLCGTIRKTTARASREQKQERLQHGFQGYRIADLPALRRRRHSGG